MIVAEQALSPKHFTSETPKPTAIAEWLGLIRPTLTIVAPPEL